MMGRPKKYKTKGERKTANKKYKKEWHKKNKLYVKKYRRKWYLKNKEKVAKKHQTPKYRLIQKKLRIKKFISRLGAPKWSDPPFYFPSGKCY